MLVIMVLVTAFGHSQTASAACGDLDPVTNTIITCGAGSPEHVVNVWGTKNSDLPRIERGQTKVLANGTTYTCPIWFPMYCVDVTVTSWFKNR